MNPFEYERAQAPEEAIHAIAATHGAKLLGGGTNLLDLMKDDVERPTRLIDITHIPLDRIEPMAEGGVRIGALARNSDTANHPLIREKYPLLAQAILAGASPQLRNMATDGGNLMQRTRCYFFMDTAFPACNKRTPGSGCAALKGFNRIHAILGASEQCIATHPSDMCVALLALDATVQVSGPKGKRAIAMQEFHRLPGTTPQRDTNLQQDEMITSIDLPAGPFHKHYHYLKVRDRNSYAFALVSVAAALDMEGQTIRGARIALGGVAHKPWRVVEAETALQGAAAGEQKFGEAADIVLRGAKGYEHNAFKVPLAKQAIVRALTMAGGAA